MDVTIKKCDQELLPGLLSLIDNEFIYNKGRTVSLATRYPTLFNNDNLANIYVVCSGGTLLATTTVRKFVLFSEERLWRGAMIGLVCTAPEARGRGFGAHLMDVIVQELKKTVLDFLVLWTGINCFYEKLGWVTEDEGVFGKVTLGALSCNYELINPLAFIDVDLDWIEKLRAKYLSQRLLRSKDDYAAIPPSVDVVEYFACEESDVEGYAIIGRKERTGYIYEMVGNPVVFPVLLESIGRHVDNLFINDKLDSVSGLWLTERRCVDWQSQNQSMWYKLSSDFTEVACKGLYIPYFDRI